MVAYIFADIEDAMRFEMAMSELAEPETLATLAADPLHQVRQYVACHVRTPTRVVDHLADDPDPITAEMALLNPSLSKRKALAEAAGPRARILARNPSLDAHVLHKLLAYNGEFAVAVQRHIANHPNVTESQLRVLAQHEDKRIHSVAQRRLQNH